MMPATTTTTRGKTSGLRIAVAKSAAQISDRAHRYRSHSPGCRPPGPRVCIFCGSTSNVDVHHIDGYEEHVEPGNLVWACRSCNTTIGVVMASEDLDRRTRQFNAATDAGAQSLGQWLTAVLSMKGESDAMSVPAAVEMIRATPPFRRSQFAHEIWKRRKDRAGDEVLSGSTKL